MASHDTLAEEFAPGIPKDRRVQPLPSISKSTDWKLAIQEHDAERAGKHFDFRLVDPATGHAHSWALPNAKLPEPGKSVLAVPQATHTATYALNFGKNKPQEITEGYGKGMVSMHALTDVDVHHSNPTAEEGETRLRFNIYKSTGPEEYAIVKVRGGNDLLVNKTLTRQRLPHLPIGEKPKAKEKDVSKIEFDNANEVMMPKYDGAHTLLDISRANKNLNLFSYREPKRHAAGLIEHTHKVPSLLDLKAPADLKGTTFRAETIAVDKDGKAIPAKDIAGMLNATVPTSRAKQQQMGAELKPVIFDVVRYKGKDVTNKPFSERYELARQAGERLGLTVAELAKTPEEKRTLLDAIRAGKHPMTTEGVVLRSAIDDGPALKAKFRPDYDVHVRGVFEAKDKSGAGKGRAGGFEYSWSEHGPVVGRIGTGLDHETARDMLANPDKYIGRVAKIEAEQKYPSGALGKPAFMEWHLDKGDIEKTAAEKKADIPPLLLRAALGSGLGAGVGAAVDKDNRTRGALVGGALGAAAGTGVHALLERTPSGPPMWMRQALDNRSPNVHFGGTPEEVHKRMGDAVRAYGEKSRQGSDVLLEVIAKNKDVVGRSAPIAVIGDARKVDLKALAEQAAAGEHGGVDWEHPISVQNLKLLEEAHKPWYARGRAIKVAGVVTELKPHQQPGALGKPAFMEWHLDKGDIEKTANSRLRAAFALRELEKPMFEGGRTFEALLHDVPVGKLDLRRSLDLPAGELMVGGAHLDPSVRGLGLGRKMYGEIMRRLPGGRLASGASVSDDAQHVWEALKRTKGYDITPNPDSLLHTRPSGTTRQMNLRVMNEEMGKRLAGEPYRKISPILYTGAIAPEALITKSGSSSAKTAGVYRALSQLGLIWP